MSHLAMLAPPWIPIPPPAYGGIEHVVSLSTAGLVDAGHRVTLFAAPGSRSPAEVHSPLAEPHPDEIQFSLFEVDHVARSFDAIDAAAEDGEPVRRRPRPHGLLRAGDGGPAADAAGAHAARAVRARRVPLLRRHGHKAQLVAISAAQREAAPEHLRDGIAVVPNPLDVDAWPFSEAAGEYLLWIGRMNDDKGPQRAIAAARAAGASAGAGGAGAARPGGVLRARGRTAHRRRHRALRRRGRRGGQARAVHRRPGAADADSLGRAVRHGDGRGDGLRHAGDRLPRGLGARGRDRRRDRLRRRGRGGDGARRRAGWTRSTADAAASRSASASASLKVVARTNASTIARANATGASAAAAWVGAAAAVPPERGA